MAEPLILAQLDGDLTYEDGGSGGTGTSTGALRWTSGHRSGVQAAYVEEATENHVTNSSFELGSPGESVAGWGHVQNGTWEYSGDRAWHGSQSMLVETDGSASGQGVGSIYNTGIAVADPIAVGETWTASAYVSGSGTIVLALVERIKTAATVYGEYLSDSVVLTDDFQRVAVTATVENASATILGMRIKTVGTQATSFYVDAVQIEEKDHATSYANSNLGTGYSTGAGTSHNMRAATVVKLPRDVPGSVVCRYSENLGASWQFAYLTNLTSGNLGAYGSITHDGDELVIESDRSLLIGPVMAFADTLSTDQRAILSSTQVWTFDTLAPIAGRFLVLGIPGTNDDAPVITLP